MNRRSFLKAASVLTAATVAGGAESRGYRRVRPGEKGWPTAGEWDQLRQAVGGRLSAIESPIGSPEFLRELKNPFYIGDQPGLTQTTGWVDGWMSQRSAFVVAAERTEDISAAVNFAREKNLRLVVKGGGHSYKGTSNAPDSLLIWTRRMRRVEVVDSFVPVGAPKSHHGEPAVTLDAGCIWMDAYDAVTTKAGRYVQGGGCTTVGVAGLIQSGGFGSFSKQFGTASSNLLQAEIVTADGQARIANAFQNPELFWALKGGGGGSFGVVTKLTLRTHTLPDFFGAVFGRVKAKSDAAYERLVAQFVKFYANAFFNPTWGEQLKFRPDGVVEISMVFQGIGKTRAEEVWRSLVDWINERESDYEWERDFGVAAIPARHFWDASWWRKNIPQAIVSDGRAGASERNFLWEGDRGQVAFFLHGYRSAWLPQHLLRGKEQARFAKALIASSRIWTVSLHFNKGLAGATAMALRGARDTAMNPEVLNAFALVIIAGAGAPAYPGLAGFDPDLAKARSEAEKINRSMDALLNGIGAKPGIGSYVSESDLFEKRWQKSFWGRNHARLARAKSKYDPTELFYVRQGVGTESWSNDGFEKSGA